MRSAVTLALLGDGAAVGRSPPVQRRAAGALLREHRLVPGGEYKLARGGLVLGAAPRARLERCA